MMMMMHLLQGLQHYLPMADDPKMCAKNPVWITTALLLIYYTSRMLHDPVVGSSTRSAGLQLKPIKNPNVWSNALLQLKPINVDGVIISVYLNNLN
jgi:hypothetical protein